MMSLDSTFNIGMFRYLKQHARDKAHLPDG